jgi:hypothetical protein
MADHLWGCVRCLAADTCLAQAEIRGFIGCDASIEAGLTTEQGKTCTQAQDMHLPHERGQSPASPGITLVSDSIVFAYSKSRLNTGLSGIVPQLA